MDRRGFFRSLRNSLSGSFVLGSLGGTAIGAVAAAAYDRRDNTQFSHAEQGEDLIIQSLLGKLGVKRPITYLDIGAFDPVYDSNTYLFYKAGGHGILVEPNPAKTARLKSVRSRDRTLAIGIGTSAQRTMTDYYVIGGPSKGNLNTFSKDEADEIQRKAGTVHFLEKVIQLPLENINTIMQQELGAAPNLLSIDTEGMDLDILKTMDFDRFRPEVICAETLRVGSDVVNVDILKLLESKRYSARGATFLNTIFVDDRLLSQPGPLTSAVRPKA